MLTVSKWHTCAESRKLHRHTWVGISSAYTGGERVMEPDIDVELVARDRKSLARHLSGPRRAAPDPWATHTWKDQQPLRTSVTLVFPLAFMFSCLLVYGRPGGPATRITREHGPGGTVNTGATNIQV